MSGRGRCGGGLDTTASPEEPQRMLVLQLVWPYLSNAEKCSVRQSCSDGRLAANDLVSNLVLSDCAGHLLLGKFPNIQGVKIQSLHAERILQQLVLLPNLCALKSFQLETSAYITNFTLCLLPSLCPELDHISIQAKDGTITPDLLRTLTKQQCLRSLHLAGCHGINSTEWQPLAALVTLTSLHLEGIKDLPFLSLSTLLRSLTSLRILSLSNCHFYTEASEPRLPIALSALHSLHSITFDRCTGAPTAHLFSPASPPNLQSISLPYSLSPSEPPIAHFPPALTHLDLSHNPLPLAALPSPPPAPLTHLDLSCTGATILPSLLAPSTATMTHLDLTQCLLSPAAYQSVSTLTSLTHLAFSVNPPTLSQLTTLTALRTLDCPAIALDHKSVPPLAALPRLSSLRCRSILLWPNLPPLAALTSLTATHAHKFTDYDFLDVAAVTCNLRALTLHNAVGLTEHIVPSLTDHLPGLSSVTLTGLLRPLPAGCARLSRHPSLKSVRLVFSMAPVADVAALEAHLQECGMAAACELSS